MSRKKRRKTWSRQTPDRHDRHLLDKFSQADLGKWQWAADQLTAYRVRQHYFLEGLRAVHSDEITEALRSTKPKKLCLNRWARVVDYKYSLEPLTSTGSLYVGGRFNIGRDIDPKKHPEFPALYVAEDYDTALHERFGADLKSTAGSLSGQEFALRSPGSFASVRVRGGLYTVFDIGVVSNLKAFAAIVGKFDMPADLKAMAKHLGMTPPWLLKTAAQIKQTFLASNWRYLPMQYGLPANPQVFGRLLVDAGFDAVLYPSTKGLGRCVVVFADDLA